MKKEYIIGIAILGGLGYLYFKKQKQKSENNLKRLINSKVAQDYDEKAKLNANDLISNLPTDVEITEIYSKLPIGKQDKGLKNISILKDSYGEIYLDFKNISEIFPEPNYDVASSILKKYFLNLLSQSNKAILTNEEKVFSINNNLSYDDRLMSKFFPKTLSKLSSKGFQPKDGIGVANATITIK